MGLFDKKTPCAICGGKVKGLFSDKIEGQYICKECYGTVDVPTSKLIKMTMNDFKQYRAFREENNLLKEKFEKSEVIDFGILDTKIVFDYKNKLFCMDKNLETTIFEGKHLTGFRISEDSMPILEGGRTGLQRFQSSIPSRVAMMAPQIEMYRRNKRMHEQNNDDKDDFTMDIKEPFKNFNLVVYFNHPYWNEFNADMGGPIFLNVSPSVEDYMRDYNEKVATMEKLARAFMKVAFDNEDEEVVTSFASGNKTAANTAASTEDVTESIRKFKELLDQGIITEEEFNAKKRQLLGI